MRRSCLLLLASLACARSAEAQGGSIVVGARAWGTANAVTAGSDSYSVINNIAGLVGFGADARTGPAVFSAYHSHYGFGAIGTLAFGAVVPLRQDLASGFSVQQFGDKAYNELSFGLGAAHRIERFSLGLKLNYRQLAVNTPSLSMSRKALVVEMGGRMQLSPNLVFGAHLYNLTQGRYTGEGMEKLPTVLKAGVSFAPLDALRVNADWVKDTNYPASLRAGMEYAVLPTLFVRTGIASHPGTAHFGLGFAAGSFSFDYAANSHSRLGWSQHLSLAYRLKKPETER